MATQSRKGKHQKETNMEEKSEIQVPSGSVAKRTIDDGGVGDMEVTQKKKRLKHELEEKRLKLEKQVAYAIQEHCGAKFGLVVDVERELKTLLQMSEVLIVRILELCDGKALGRVQSTCIEFCMPREVYSTRLKQLSIVDYVVQRKAGCESMVLGVQSLPSSMAQVEAARKHGCSDWVEVETDVSQYKLRSSSCVVVFAFL